MSNAKPQTAITRAPLAGPNESGATGRAARCWRWPASNWSRSRERGRRARRSRRRSSRQRNDRGGGRASREDVELGDRRCVGGRRGRRPGRRRASPRARGPALVTCHQGAAGGRWNPPWLPQVINASSHNLDSATLTAYQGRVPEQPQVRCAARMRHRHGARKLRRQPGRVVARRAREVERPARDDVRVRQWRDPGDVRRCGRRAARGLERAQAREYAGELGGGGPTRAARRSTTLRSSRRVRVPRPWYGHLHHASA